MIRCECVFAINGNLTRLCKRHADWVEPLRREFSSIKLQNRSMFELLSQFRDNLHLHKHDAKVPVEECLEAPCQKVMKYAEKRKCDQCGGDEENYNGEWLCRKCNGMCG